MLHSTCRFEVADRLPRRFVHTESTLSSFPVHSFYQQRPGPKPEVAPITHSCCLSEISASQNDPMTVIAPQVKPFSPGFHSFASPESPSLGCPVDSLTSGFASPKLNKFQKEWNVRFNDSSVESLDALVDDLTNCFLKQRSAGPSSSRPHRTGRPSALPRRTDTSRPEPRNNTDRLRYDPVEASRILRFYRLNPKKTVGPILGGSSPFCEIPRDDIVRHFANIFRKAIPDDFPFPTYPEPVADDFLVAPFVASEKGFRENEGCVEQNFLLEEAIAEAKRSRSDLALAWLDLENAFGSIPHAFIIVSLKSVGVPVAVINIISSLYSNAKSETRCCSDWSSPITMEAGVRQGCSLSAILFNLSLEQIPRPAIEVDSEGYSLNGKSLRCLAYADDLVIDKSKNSLQTLLDSMLNFV
ncbi:reverse transcriptase domain-containing protein [Trichonephila clavipes]|nr:reverse transcriptase domain-containing protein [Trichonephila clavipes]